MATYAVGDLQGCYEPLARALDSVNFDQSKDTLLCVGDLVNRGPHSLKVLNFLRSLEKQCISVLGNHDIHLLSMIYGVREPKTNDTFTDVLDAPNLPEICEWLRQQPLMIVDDNRKYIVCHAGIYPWWTLSQAKSYANEVAAVFQTEKKLKKMLRKLYGNTPRKWHDDLQGSVRHRFIINAFTRMRFCTPKGNLNFSESGYRGKVRKNRFPWFLQQDSSFSEYRIVFGHWSALGFLNTGNYLGLDTGYVWGRSLTLAKIPKKPNKKIKIYQTYE
jgi:bis(5'-nucleosyl)-tetraphosphatase (symmetrical)